MFSGRLDVRFYGRIAVSAERMPILSVLILLYPAILKLMKQYTAKKEAVMIGVTAFWAVILVVLSIRGERERYGLCAPKKVGRWLVPAVVLPLANLGFSGYTEIELVEFGGQIVVLLGNVVWEEVLFRGILLRRFLKNHPPFFAILVESLLFGCMHLVNIETYAQISYAAVQAVVAVGVGFWLGVVACESRSVCWCILAHACINVSCLTAGPAALPIGITVLQGTVYAAIGVFYFFAGLFYINKQKKEMCHETIY